MSRAKVMNWFAGQRGDVTRLRGGRLFRKYFLLILALVCGALLISSAIGLYFSYQENQRALAVLQREKAIAAAARVEQFLFQIEQQLKYAALPQLGVEGLEQRRIEFLKLLRQADAVTDVAQIDARGREQISESRLKMSEIGTHRDWSQEPAFKLVKPGQTWFGPVYFRKETEPYMSVAVRASATGPVTVADVNLKFIWDVVSRIKVGQKGKAYVVDGTGLLVADPDIGLVLRKTDLSGLEQVKASLRPEDDQLLATLARDHAGHLVLSAFAPIELREDRDGRGREPLGWKVFVEQPVTEVYAGLQASVYRSIALMVAGVLFSILAALWLAGNMVRPIRELQESAQRIGEGDLETQIDVRSGDELQALAAQFNRMTAQLRESYAGLERKVEVRTAELKQTLDQQTATADILRVISSSPTDVQPVFDVIVERAVRLCGARFGRVYRYEGGVIHMVSSFGLSATGLGAVRRVFPRPASDDTIVGLVIGSRRPYLIPDIAQDASVPVLSRQMIEALGTRSQVTLPMLRAGEPIGAITMGWGEAQGYDERKIELLRTFADQAVIAIENVRLFNETKEALEQQKASADVLGAISNSISDAQPVFDKIVESCARLFAGHFVGIGVIREDGLLHAVAYHGPNREQFEAAFPIPVDAESATGRAIAAREVMHYPNVFGDENVPPNLRRSAERVGGKSVTVAPMLWEGRGVGGVFVARDFTGAFSEKSIRQLKTFADQAVIAIQNARLFREIQEKSAQLEIANKHKSDFLANMSHELRTPLNAIIGFSEVLSERMFGELNEKQADYMKDIHESGKHLLSLINDILDLSKIEAGRMDLEVSSFHLPSALSNAMTLVRERAQRHGIALDLEVDPGIGEFSADERKFKQILVNLLSNAVKFTPDGGRVDLSVRLNGKAVEVAVRDTGIGIAPEDQQKVFAEFVQVGRDYTRKAEGTGLGLALSRRFVELHGGEIRLESAPGMGSTFTFTIPIRA